MQNTSSWLRIADIHVTDTGISYDYDDYAGRTFTIGIDYDVPVAARLAAYPQGKVQKLLNYLGLVEALNLFNYEYYDEVIGRYTLTRQERDFFETTCFNGLAEFRYVCKIPLNTLTHFRGELDIATDDDSPSLDLHGGIVTNGGGKDGATAGEILHEVLGEDLAWFTLNKKASRQGIIDRSPFQQQVSAARTLPADIHIQKYQGHKPLSAELGFFATLAALLMKKRYVFVANEYSANEPNLIAEGIAVNHQFTKSFAFEIELDALLKNLNIGVGYCSILRPLYELQIIDIFKDYTEYHHTFISCNKGVHGGKWCLDCAKCAFVVLALTALKPSIAADIWGSDLAVSLPSLQPHVIELVSAHTAKPFDCVGTLEECQLAISMLHANKELWNKLSEDYRSVLETHLPTNTEKLRKEIMSAYDRENNIPEELRSDIYSAFAARLGD